MRSAMRATLLLGCGLSAMGSTVRLQAPDFVTLAIPGCHSRPGYDPSGGGLCSTTELGSFGASGETMQGFAFDVDPESDKDAAKIPADLTPAPGSADVSSGKPWTRGPEPPAAALAAGGFALIALLSWRRRLSSATHRTRRRVYTIREMA